MEERDFLFGDMIINHKNPRLFFYGTDVHYVNASDMLNVVADKPTADTRILLYTRKLTHEGELL